MERNSVPASEELSECCSTIISAANDHGCINVAIWFAIESEICHHKKNLEATVAAVETSSKRISNQSAAFLLFCCAKITIPIKYANMKNPRKVAIFNTADTFSDPR